MRITSLALLLTSLLAASLRAGEFPAAYDCAPCVKAPTIDGVIDAEEWKPAQKVEFEITFLGLNPLKSQPRTCEFRAMSSANGLYVALRVPDEVRQQSFAPLDFDFAQLAFCRGKDVAEGDDRKVLAPGIYIDKHVITPGKDADDARRDGRGAATYKDGAYYYEWAVLLDSGDKHDLQAKPGDELRFNLTHFDGFKFDLKGTMFGGLYGAEQDKAGKWGVLRLAAKVAADDGAAFAGPAWVAALFKSLPFPANRLRLDDSEIAGGRKGPVAKALVSFSYRDTKGQTQTGKARLFLPESIRDSKAKVPLYFSAGYELDELSAQAHLERGYAVVSACALPANPLVRTANPDVVLLHSVRAMPFVDDARVVIGGTSAGGYMTLMLAAETFPLTGAASDVPPFNLGYNAALYVKQKQQITAPKPADRRVPALGQILPMIEQATGVYGADTDGPQWKLHSPLAHVNTITCPVSVFWTTADVLVPINQVGAKWVRPWNREQFPEGLTFDPAALCGRDGQLKLTDVLSEKDYELFEIPLPAGVSKRNAPTPAPAGTIELPISATKQWSIAIVDEGPPEPFNDHLKHHWVWKRDAFFAQMGQGKIAEEQLTPAKLGQLVDRYAGREWLTGGLTHLDDVKAEQADVLRGLRTYVAQGPGHARRFAELYGKLSKPQQTLPAEEVAKLSNGR